MSFESNFLSPLPRVFLSYARSDGEPYAQQLRERLEINHPEISLWQDRVRMQGGVGWWKQIAEALESVEYLVLVITPAAIRSETCKREWRYARQHGVCVYPVMGVSSQEIGFDSMPRWMRKVHFYNLEYEWDVFINGLRTPCQSNRVPFMALDLPAKMVDRPALDKQIRQFLLREEHYSESDLLNIALCGTGGLGKTTLALAACYNEEVISTFDDGILWVTLGERPQIQQAITKLYAALTGERPAFVDEEDASYHLAERLEGRRYLIVIDDVWNPAHLLPFLRGGRSSSRLITTRFIDVANSAEIVHIAEMTNDQAVHMLTQKADLTRVDPVAIVELADRLARWPLLLELAGSALASRIRRGDTFDNALRYIDRKLNTHGVTAFDYNNPTARNQAVASTLNTSLDMIGEENRRQLYQLAVFPEDINIPLKAVAALWSFDQWEAEELVEQFENLSLLKFQPQSALLQLHDLIRQYLLEHIDDLPVQHGRMADHLLSVDESLDDYRVRWLPFHLAQAQRLNELRLLLVSLDWLHSKIQLVGPALLVDDFSYFPHDADLQVLRETIRLSAYVVDADPDQLPSQLLARLPDADIGTSLIRKICKGWVSSCWLVPLKSLLAVPGSPLVATLVGHTGRVRSVSFSPTGKIVVSGANDATVRVWDVDRAVQLRELSGHKDWIRAVVVFPDGKSAASVSDDHTIRVWDLVSFTCVQVIDTVFDWLRVLTVSHDCNTLFTADDGENIKVWNWKEGRQVGTLIGHSAKINALASLSNDRLISVSDDRTIRLWNVHDKKEVSKLLGHTGRIMACAVLQDESAFLTAGTDQKIFFWDMGGAGEISSRVITDKAPRVRDLGFVCDGRQVITASEDRRFDIWEVLNGVHASEFIGHTDSIGALAVSPATDIVVSASDDGTLKIWRLGVEINRHRDMPCHTGIVRALACSGNDAICLSAGNDRKLMKWDVNRGEFLALFNDIDVHRIAVFPNGNLFVGAEGDAAVRVRSIKDLSIRSVFHKHADRVRAVAVSPSGNYVASSGDDRFIRIWEAANGNEVTAVQVGAHIRALAFLEETQTILSASVSGRIKLLSAITGQILMDFDGHTSQVNAIDTCVDRQILLSGSDDHTLRVWDLITGACKFVLAGHAGHVRDLAVQDNLMVSVAEDATIRAWDITAGTQLAVFTGESPFLSCAFSANDQRMIAGDRQGSVHFFEPRLVL